MKKFEVAPLDRMAVIISIGVSILLIAIPCAILLTPEDKMTIVPVIMPLVILGVAFGLKPSAYVIGNGKLLVKRPGWSDAEFQLHDISSVQKIKKVPSKGLIRTLGCGGLFGYYGYFSNRELGSMTWYLTKREDVLLLEIKSEKVLVSPKDTDAFLSQLQAQTAVIAA